jgi:2-oxoglutarate dehydrogenase complex dehydrogenase (E1) component-like enzyme
MAMRLRKMDLIGICRPASAATAEGSKDLHVKRLGRLMNAIFKYAKVAAKN